MMKRIITVCIMLIVSVSVLKAQDNFSDTVAKKPVFERYSFFSQWQLTLNGGLFSNMGNLSGGFDPSYGFGVVLAKPLNHIWNVRLQYIYGNIDGSEVDINKMFPSLQKGKFIATVNEANLNFTFSLTDLFGGYQPKRFLGVYLLAGGGANFVTGHIEDPTGNTIFTIGGDDELQIRPIVSFGAGFRFRLSQSWALNLESAFKFSSQFWDDAHYNGEPSIYNYTSLGVTYDLGICPSVKARIEAEKQLEAERAAAEAERIAREKEECEKAKNNEKKLQERIASLEKEMNDKINKELAASKQQQQELQAKLDDIKSKQATYYALPFSILFPIEGHQVPASQQNVLKAMAKVINDDKDGEYVIIGFADYTGSDAYNDKLSQKRAESVKNTLVKKYKVNENRLKVDSKGKREAFGDIKFNINRRASIVRTVK